LAFALGAVIATIAPSARAEPAEREREAARALDAEAEQLILENKLAEALERYERSVKLVDLPTHWLMVGRLRAQLGRVAGAVDALERAAKFPLRAGAPPAQRRAAERARVELEPLRARVPTLTVRVIGATPTEVLIDGAAIDRDALDEPHPLDPGSHRVVARAEGQPPAIAEQTLREGEQITLELRFVQGAGTRGDAVPSSTSAGTSRVLGYVALGLGGAGIVAGAITGLATLSRASQLATDCPQKTACPPEDQAVIDQGRAFGTASTVSFAVGGAALVTGVVLLVVGKRSAPPPPTAAAEVHPWIGAGVGGLGGTF
jgi:hypothetical protein